MSDLLQQLESYGDQLEVTVPHYEFEPHHRPRWRNSGPMILAAAAAILVIVGLALWTQRGDEETQRLDIVDQPEVPSPAPTASVPEPQPDTAEATVESTVPPEPTDPVPAAAPFVPDECEGLNPGLNPLQPARPGMRVGIGDIESQIGALPRQLPAGSYSTDSLGVALQFDAPECMTLVEENPGMLTFVPAGGSLDVNSPWMSVLIPSAVSTNGSADFRAAQPVDTGIGEWASQVDAVIATNVGSPVIAGIQATEWELTVNTDSLEPFFCPRGQCASVVRPQVTWWGTFRRPTLSHRPGFIHVDSIGVARVTEMEVDGRRLWIWRQAPTADSDFFDKSDRWLQAWQFGVTTEALNHTGGFGALDAGERQLPSGALVVVPDDDWTLLSSSDTRSVFVPPISTSIDTPTHVVQILRAVDADFGAINFDETIAEFAELADTVGWSLSQDSPAVLGDYATTAIDVESFGPSLGIGTSLWTIPSGRLHLVSAGDAAWIILIGAPDAAAVDVLEQAASTLFVGAILPDWAAET